MKELEKFCWKRSKEINKYKKKTTEKKWIRKEKNNSTKCWCRDCCKKRNKKNRSN